MAVASSTRRPPPGIAINLWTCSTTPSGERRVHHVAAWLSTPARLRSRSPTTSRRHGQPEPPNIPGDTVIITAGGSPRRLDMVFRILPGVGNYVQVGNRLSGVRKRPDQVAAAASGDLSFWGEYMADNGAFGTGGNGTTGPGHGASWDPNRWNSARCDSAGSTCSPRSATTPTCRCCHGLWRRCTTKRFQVPEGSVSSETLLPDQPAGGRSHTRRTPPARGTYRRCGRRRRRA